MKKFKFIATLFVAAMLSTGLTAIAEEKTKEYNESWPASGISTLEVVNKFGEVKVTNEGGSEITIDVTITVEAANERKAEDLLGMIEVEFRKSQSTLKAETRIGNNFKGQRKFSIDYEINIPSDKNLKITNKYGNTIVNKLEADGEFITKYGNFTANTLNTPEGGDLNVILAYGNANIGAATNLDVVISYSPITIGEVNTLDVTSKYSTVNVEEAGDIKIESKYDKFNFEEVESVTASTKYSHIRIEELAKSLKIEAGYGGIKVGEVSDDFEFISVTNSYGSISLGLEGLSYEVDASCHYCGISYPEDEFTGDRIKENNSRTIKGKVGTGTGGKIMVRSRYGEIKLRD
ncbi:MAG: hypothetical protein ABFS16_02465 [Bacteroidota bacterium]